MRVLFAAIAMIATSPAMAEVTVTYPISIPQECVELAQREGVPVVITSKYQAVKARVKLYRLSGRDPVVRECRAAVDRARRSAEQYARAPTVSVTAPIDKTSPQ